MSDQLNAFTSTGTKFWRHPSQMKAYRAGQPNTIISVHVSPTSECNLRCSYCSVSKRTKHNQIPLAVIQDYIMKLKTCGLRAVIITGGGEPLMYPEINELISWLRYECGINVALITNGTQSDRLDKRSWQALSWVRISMNNIPDFLDRVSINLNAIRSDCVVGGSIILAKKNRDWKWLGQTRMLADMMGMKYIRLLPDCMVAQDELTVEHRNVACICQWLHDKRYFHQRKNHSVPKATVCHQAYFRPYLSEEPSRATGEPGTVFPCDSVVLNGAAARFVAKYQLCPASDVLEFLNHRIDAPFRPCEDCCGCVFAGNVDQLDDWKEGKLDRFAEFQVPLKHEDFV